MLYDSETIGVGTYTTEGTVVMITSPDYPFGRNQLLDVYRLRYHPRYAMSNMAIIRLLNPCIPCTKEEFAKINPFYNEFGVEYFYSKQISISDFEDMPVDCLTVTMGVKNRFKVGQEVADGIIVGAVLSSHYEKSIQSSNWSAWDKFGDWRSKPIYSVMLHEPTYKFSMEEFLTFYTEDLKYFTDSYKEELYYKQDKNLYLSLPEDAIHE